MVFVVVYTTKYGRLNVAMAKTIDKWEQYHIRHYRIVDVMYCIVS